MRFERIKRAWQWRFATLIYEATIPLPVHIVRERLRKRTIRPDRAGRLDWSGYMQGYTRSDNTFEYLLPWRTTPSRVVHRVSRVVLPTAPPPCLEGRLVALTPTETCLHVRRSASLWPLPALILLVGVWTIALGVVGCYTTYKLLPRVVSGQELVQYLFKVLMVWGLLRLVAYFSFDFTAQREIYELIKLCRLMDLPAPPDYTKPASAK
jgi:hypothetical protein